MAYFGTDGIRLHAEEFTSDFLAAVLDGLIAYHGNPNFSLLIAGDTRASTATILRDLTHLAAARGISVASAGVFPTPAINFYANNFDFAIDITASHNPATYNGLKIFQTIDGHSAKLGAEGKAAIEESLQNYFSGSYNQIWSEKCISPTAPQAPGGMTFFATSPESRKISSADSDHHELAIDSYLNHLRNYLGACDFHGLHLAMDCANGATSVISGQLFQEFGAEVTILSADQNFGTAINDGCGSTHLEKLQQSVVANKLPLGVAFDGDGDRCMLVDQTGAIVDGDKILAILAEYLGLSSFVVTVMANQGLFAWAASHNIALEVTDVGDQNVYARMLEKGLKLGGEQSGHIILPYEPMGDGMLTALMLAKIITEQKTTLAALSSQIPTFPQTMLNLPATREQKSHLASPAAEQIIQKYSDFLTSRGGRLLVRPSGTEDLVRLTMWGNEDTNIEALNNELAKELKEVL